jgi:hypothetical protein
MNQQWQNISISGENKIDALPVRDIKSLANRYPYSFFHQFLLCTKLKNNDDALYKKQVSKTALYSSNLPWLEYLLNKDTTPRKDDDTIREPEPVEIAEPAPETISEPITDDAIELERESMVGHETKETASLVSSILDREKELANQETELNFEPLYTVDYFAAQGIKNTSETIPADKLGKQLRSFTEWLKIMKRLPAEETVQMNESDEKKIQTEAEDSNEVKEVITEAMAEVLLKQGKRHKALEIYQKLSLQHPEKSPYFAALIEQLKG